VGEQNELNKTTAPNISEISRPLAIFLLYFQIILPDIVQEINCYMEQKAQARNKPDIPHSQQISMKDLSAFLAIIVNISHDHKPGMKLYWTKNELYNGPFYCSVLPYDHFLKTLSNTCHTQTWNIIGNITLNSV
jgi:hypothetical protein